MRFWNRRQYRAVPYRRNVSLEGFGLPEAARVRPLFSDVLDPESYRREVPRLDEFMSIPGVSPVDWTYGGVDA